MQGEEEVVVVVDLGGERGTLRLQVDGVGVEGVDPLGLD